MRDCCHRFAAISAEQRVIVRMSQKDTSWIADEAKPPGRRARARLTLSIGTWDAPCIRSRTVTGPLGTCLPGERKHEVAGRPVYMAFAQLIESWGNRPSEKGRQEPQLLSKGLVRSKLHAYHTFAHLIDSFAPPSCRLLLSFCRFCRTLPCPRIHPLDLVLAAPSRLVHRMPRSTPRFIPHESAPLVNLLAGDVVRIGFGLHELAVSGVGKGPACEHELDRGSRESEVP